MKAYLMRYPESPSGREVLTVMEKRDDGPDVNLNQGDPIHFLGELFEFVMSCEAITSKATRRELLDEIAESTGPLKLERKKHRPVHPKAHIIQTAAVTYEWDVETWDGEDGDILDHFHADTLEELLMNHGVLGPHDHVVLVKDLDDGARSWCYFDEPVQARRLARKNGRPAFCDGALVPKKLLAEARKFLDEKGIPRLPYPAHPGLDDEGTG